MKKLLFILSLFLFMGLGIKTEAASLDLLYPNGGENLKGGETYEFTWNQEDLSMIIISILTAGGTVVEQGVSVNVDINATQGNYQYTIPDRVNLQGEDNYVVSIVGYPSGDQGNPRDESDTPFTIYRDKPDLVIDDVLVGYNPGFSAFEESTIFLETNLAFQFHISNIGNSMSSGDYYVISVEGDGIECSGSTSTTNDSFTVLCRGIDVAGPSRLGEYTMTATVDYDGVIDEDNENNNSKTITFEVVDFMTYYEENMDIVNEDDIDENDNSIIEILTDFSNTDFEIGNNYTLRWNYILNQYSTVLKLYKDGLELGKIAGTASYHDAYYWDLSYRVKTSIYENETVQVLAGDNYRVAFINDSIGMKVFSDNFSITSYDYDSVSYPGYSLSLQTNFSNIGTVYLRTTSAGTAEEPYYIDIYGTKNLIGEDSEKFIIHSDIKVTGQSSITHHVNLEDFGVIDSQKYEYGLLVCSSFDGCVAGSTNSIIMNIGEWDGVMSDVYRNESLGFTLTFPAASWEDWFATENADGVFFGLPAQDELFFISRMTLAEWEDYQNQVPRFNKYINKNNEYVYFYSQGQDVIEELQPAARLINSMVSNLEFIYDDSDDEVIEEPAEEPEVAPEIINQPINNQQYQGPNIPVTQVDQNLTNRLRGRILLQVEDHGEAWYVRPDNGRRMYMKDGSTAYGMMRNLGLGISNADLQKIPVGIEQRFKCLDSDGDGLCNKLEEGLGTDPNNPDSDGDGYNDGAEINSNYNPLSREALSYDNNLINRLRGQILLQVESRGEAWYINPDDGKRYYMKDGPAAYQIMRFLSLGISNKDLSGIDTE